MNVLEQVLANPPSLAAVLEDKVYHKLFVWHLCSRFAPENLLFRDAVIEFRAIFSSGDVAKAESHAASIVKTFLRDSSPLEICARHAVSLENLHLNTFDVALEEVDRDLARALQMLWTTPVFGVCLQNKAQLDKLNVKEAAKTSGDLKKKDLDPLFKVRSAFGVDTKLVMRRHFEVGSPYSFLVSVAGNDTPIGFCRQADDMFSFFDKDEKLLLQTPAAELLGRSNLPKTPRRLPTLDEDDDIAGSGCFGKSPNKRASVKIPPQNDPSQFSWHFKHNGAEVGPLDFRSASLLWRFHLLPAESSVRRSDGKVFDTVSDCPEFPIVNQIQLIDPTALAEFGAMEL